MCVFVLVVCASMRVLRSVMFECVPLYLFEFCVCVCLCVAAMFERVVLCN